MVKKLMDMDFDAALETTNATKDRHADILVSGNIYEGKVVLDLTVCSLTDVSASAIERTRKTKDITPNQSILGKRRETLLLQIPNLVITKPKSTTRKKLRTLKTIRAKTFSQREPLKISSTNG